MEQQIKMEEVEKFFALPSPPMSKAEAEFWEFVELSSLNDSEVNLRRKVAFVEKIDSRGNDKETLLAIEVLLGFGTQGSDRGE